MVAIVAMVLVLVVLRLVLELLVLVLVLMLMLLVVAGVVAVVVVLLCGRPRPLFRQQALAASNANTSLVGVVGASTPVAGMLGY